MRSPWKFWRDSSPKNENYVMNYSPSCCSKAISPSFIFRTYHWCHMDYFNVILTTFLSLEHVCCIAVYAGSEKLVDFIKNIFVYLCSEDEWRFYRFGTTWEWVINDRIFIFGWTIPLRRPTHGPSTPSEPFRSRWKISMWEKQHVQIHSIHKSVGKKYMHD